MTLDSAPALIPRRDLAERFTPIPLLTIADKEPHFTSDGIGKAFDVVLPVRFMAYRVVSFLTSVVLVSRPLCASEREQFKNIGAGYMHARVNVRTSCCVKF